MKIRYIAAIVVATGAGVFLAWRQFRQDPASETHVYQFAPVTRADVSDVVSATGSVEAQDSVEVGTQVSGTVERVLVDFNAPVEQGQLLAMLDPDVLDSQVQVAEAELMRAEAQLEQAQANLEVNQPVFEKGFLSENEFVPFRVAVKTAQAARLGAQANLDRARRNREYAEIRSPIHGIVVDRAVEPGQTVAASFNTPRLFTIAADLSRMRILAQVDESDIGRIKVGQDAHFTVAAHPEHDFEAVVKEIRLNPVVDSNVVHYVVVLDTANPDGLLLPGMTASVDFVVAQARNVLTVPTSALNLRPNEEMMAILRERRAQREGGEGTAAPGGGRPGVQGGGAFPGGPGGGHATPREERGRAMLWRMGPAGQPEPLMVRTGVTDGQVSEVQALQGELQEGTQVISRVEQSRTPLGSSRMMPRRMF